MRFEHSKKSISSASTPIVAILNEADWKKGTWQKALSSDLCERVATASERLKQPPKAGAKVCVPGRKKSEEDLWVALLPEDRSMYCLLEFARDTLKIALDPSHKKLMIALVEVDKRSAHHVADAFGAALSARIFLMPVFGKREKDVKPWQLSEVSLMSPTDDDLEWLCYGYATGEGTNLARHLATLPPNILNTRGYGKRIREVASSNGLVVKFYDRKQLKKMGAGAFTAVDQGDPHSDGGIYELTYAPPKAKNGGTKTKTIHLVGKGLCFDTGGHDIKINGGMHTMKGDMQGSAVALATLMVASRLKLPMKS